MKSYCTNLECKLCGAKLSTKWHKIKLFWWIEKKKLIHKHLKCHHKMGLLEVMFR